MARQYSQLTMEEREQFQMALWEGKSLRAIARELKRSPATLSRELRRNGSWSNRRYIPRIAQERAQSRIQARGKRIRLKDAPIRQYVHAKLREGYSPEQIAGRIRIDHPQYRISHEAIYQYVYTQYRRGGYGVCTGTDLRKYLRRRHKVRHPRKILYAVEKGPIANKISIDLRPREVEARSLPGHWEGDTIESKKGSAGLNTLVERMSGYVFVSKLPDRKSETTAHIVTRRLQRIPQRLRKTLTLDNGPENARHEDITRWVGTQIFFAHPYHFWERGTNENTNGLIRWYLPKGTDFTTINDEHIKNIEYRLNTRPRKRLKWRTPLEVLNSFLLH